MPRNEVVHVPDGHANWIPLPVVVRGSREVRHHVGLLCTAIPENDDTSANIVGAGHMAERRRSVGVDVAVMPVERA